MHTYANVQINDITRHYSKKSTVSKRRQEAYQRSMLQPIQQNTANRCNSEAADIIEEAAMLHHDLRCAIAIGQMRIMCCE